MQAPWSGDGVRGGVASRDTRLLYGTWECGRYVNGGAAVAREGILAAVGLHNATSSQGGSGFPRMHCLLPASLVETPLSSPWTHVAKSRGNVCSRRELVYFTD